jgi:thiamine monophosphate synthase
LPVVALGGVNGATAKRLIGTGVVGLAAVEGLL